MSICKNKLIELAYMNVQEGGIAAHDRLSRNQITALGFKKHDWDLLANDWDAKELEGWGLEGFPFENDIDEIEQEIKDERSEDTCEKCGKAI